MRDKRSAAEFFFSEKVDRALRHGRLIDKPPVHALSQNRFHGPVHAGRNHEPFGNRIANPLTGFERRAFILAFPPVPHFFTHHALQRLQPGIDRSQFLRSLENETIELLLLRRNLCRFGLDILLLSANSGNHTPRLAIFPPERFVPGQCG